MSSQTILAAIARSPMLRTSQIANQLDVALDQVDMLLRPHMVAGTVVEHDVVAPNQRPAMAYEVSEQFKLTSEYRAIMRGEPMPDEQAAKSDEESAAAPVVAAAPAPAPAPAASAPTVDPTTRRLSKPDRAVELIKQRGPMTNADMHAALGIKQGASPSSFLGHAVQAGRLARDGDMWVLGSGKPQVAEKPADALESGAVLDQRDKGNKPLQELKRALAEPLAPSDPTRCRFAVWSDGKVEIEFPSLPSVVLTTEEFKDLVRFVGTLP